MRKKQTHREASQTFLLKKTINIFNSKTEKFEFVKKHLINPVSVYILFYSRSYRRIFFSSLSFLSLNKKTKTNILNFTKIEENFHIFELG